MMPSFYKTDADGSHYGPLNLTVPLANRGFAILWDDFQLAEERQKSLALLYEQLDEDGVFERAPGKLLREYLFQEAVQRELAHIEKGRKLLVAFGHIEDDPSKLEPETFVYPTTRSFSVSRKKGSFQNQI